MVYHKMYNFKFSRTFFIKLKSFIKNLIKRLTIPIGVYLYAEKARRKMKVNQDEKAIQILIKGSKAYPSNYQILVQLVDLLMKNKKWKQAIDQWKTIFKIKKGRLDAQAYLGYSEALQFDKKIKQSEGILIRGLKQYPSNGKISMKLAENLTTQKKWEEAKDVWSNFFEIERENLPINVFLKGALVYRKLRDYEYAETIIKNGIDRYPKNKKLLIAYADLAIYKMDWNESLKRLENACSFYQKDIPMNIYIKKSMVNQIIGNISEANHIFDYILENYKERIENDKLGYRKIVVFNNGESKIEFYKMLRKTETAVITFDSLNMVWKNKPFGFKLLSRQNIDIIAVRKKRPNTHHQDLSVGEFYNSVHLMLNKYYHRVAYGYSLGGYTSLYYGSCVDCTILSLAPRLSIHPKYGKTKQIQKYEFKHSLSLPYNPKNSSIIVYDPKEQLDNTFVKEDVIKAYPNSTLVDIPYGGHGIAPHLLRMGLLKDFILTVINKNETPKYDRTKKVKSNIYFRVLGQACLKRNKLKWARALAERSVGLLPDDKYGIKLKINVLMKMKKYDEALEYAKTATTTVPDVLEVREMLINLYMKTGDIYSAEKDLKNAIDYFGTTDKLTKWTKIIKEKKMKHKNNSMLTQD